MYLEEDSLGSLGAMLVFVSVLFLLAFGLSKPNNSEEENRIITELGAIERTVVITGTKATNGSYTTFSWSFHRPTDQYNQPPHTATIENGQIIEIDGKSIKEVPIEIPVETPEKNIPDINPIQQSPIPHGSPSGIFILSL